MSTGALGGRPEALELRRLLALLPPLKGRDEAKTAIVEGGSPVLDGPTALVLAPPFGMRS